MITRKEAQLLAQGDQAPLHEQQLQSIENGIRVAAGTYKMHSIVMGFDEDHIGIMLQQRLNEWGFTTELQLDARALCISWHE